LNREILRLAIPNIISNITVPLLGMVDLAILGHLENELYIGGIALGGMIFNYIYAFFSFLRMGTSGFTAQAYGRRDEAGMIHNLLRALTFAVGGALLLILLRVPIARLSFYLLPGSEAVESLAAQYFLIRIFAAPATLGQYAFAGWFIGMQNSRAPMWVAIFVNVINILFCFLFVFGMGMKMDGVAWGAVIAQYSGLLLSAVFFFRHYRGYLKRAVKREILEWNTVRRFMMVNKDIVIRTLCLIFSLSFFTARSAVFGDTILAINTVLLQYFFVFSYITDGFAFAAESLVGKYTGAGDEHSLRRVVRNLFGWGMTLSLPFTAVYFLFDRAILLLMTDNANVLREAAPYMFWVTLVPLITFAAFIWDGIYIGATASAPMRNTLLIATFAVFLPSYYLLIPYGNHGLWLALMFFMASRAILLTLFSEKSIFRPIRART